MEGWSRVILDPTFRSRRGGRGCMGTKPFGDTRKTFIQREGITVGGSRIGRLLYYLFDMTLLSTDAHQVQRPHQACCARAYVGAPPEMPRVSPLTQYESLLARKHTTRATSTGSATRPRGVMPARPASICSTSAVVLAVPLYTHLVTGVTYSCREFRREHTATRRERTCRT